MKTSGSSAFKTRPKRVDTRSAKRALRRASGQQARFQRHSNRVLNRAMVADAERGQCLIALEDLEGVKDRVQVKRRQRARMQTGGSTNCAP